MIYSLTNLSVVGAASRDPHRRALNAVHLAEDGSTVAADGVVLLAASPLEQDSVTFPDVGELDHPGDHGTSVDPETVEQAIKNMPRGKSEMAYAALTRNSDGMVELTTTDLRHEWRVAGQKKRDPFPDWEGALKIAGEKATTTRVCVDRRKLAALLKLLDDACGSRDQQPLVFIELGQETDSIVLRAENRVTNQRVIGVMTPYQTRGQWLRPTKWERRVLGRAPKRRKK